MGLFDNIGQVRSSIDSNYVREGHYLFLVENAKLSQNRANEAFVVLEMVCVKVFNDAASYLPLDAEEQGKKLHFEGERASHLIKNGGKGVDMFLPNIKAMITGVMGIPESEVTPDLVEKIFVTAGKESEWRGIVVEVEARHKKTKAGNDFTRITYKRAVDPEEFEILGVTLPPEWAQAYAGDDTSD